MYKPFFFLINQDLFVTDFIILFHFLFMSVFVDLPLTRVNILKKKNEKMKESWYGIQLSREPLSAQKEMHSWKTNSLTSKTFNSIQKP